MGKKGFCKRISEEKQIWVWLALMILMVPFCYTIFYALPSTDDFGMAAGISKDAILTGAVSRANEFYMTWGGAWPYFFLQVFLNPLLRASAGSHLYGLEMEVYFIIFFATLYLPVRAVAEKLWRMEKKHTRLAYLILVVVFLNTGVYYETFYWFVGAGYLFAYSLLFVTLALCVRYFADGHLPHWKYLLMCILGFIGCMSYTEAVLVGVPFLLFAYRDFVRREWKWKKSIPFVIWVIGGLVSLLCPGTFARSSLFAGVTPFTLLKNTTVLTVRGILVLFANPLVIVMLVVFVIAGIVFREKIGSGWHPLAAVIISGLSLWITYFPLCMGSADQSYLPNRYEFIFNVHAILLLAFCAVSVGAWTTHTYGIVLNKKNLRMAAALLMAMLYICLFPTQYYKEMPYFETAFSTGQVEAVYQEWKDIFEIIEWLPDDNVTFDRTIVDSPIIKTPGLTSDPENAVNKEIANYFGKESICINWHY